MGMELIIIISSLSFTAVNMNSSGVKLSHVAVQECPRHQIKLQMQPGEFKNGVDTIVQVEKVLSP